MSITPAEIQQQVFSEAKRGYDPGEVDVFLRNVASDVDAMLRKIADLKGRLNNAEKQLANTQAQLASSMVQTPSLPAKSESPYGATEQQISAALITAQQSADRIVDEAQAQARKIRDEADSKAREVIREALAEKQVELDEIERLKASRERFRDEYLKLIQHFADDAANAFPASLHSSRLQAEQEPLKNNDAKPVASAPMQIPNAQPRNKQDDFVNQKTVLAPQTRPEVIEDDDLD